MTTPDTCPECGAELGGLGKCWGDGCDYDHRTVGRGGPEEGRVALDDALGRPEKEIQAAIKRTLQAVAGDRVFICDTSQPLHPAITPGLPDLILIVEGWGVHWVEVKRPDGSLSDSQKVFRDALQDAGASWDVWRSEEDAINWWEAANGLRL